MIETLADHFTEQARGGPAAGSPALIWHGEAIAYGELNMMVDAIAGDIERLEPPAGKPVGKPVGIRAKKSPEAIAMILACLRQRLPFVLPSVELAPETLDQLFAQADVSHVLAPRDRASGAGWITAAEPKRGGDVEWPPPGAGGVSFMLTTSGSTGLPKIVPLLSEGIDQVHRVGERPVRDRGRHRGAQLRAAELRPLPARHLDDAQVRRLRRDGGPGPGDQRRLPGRPHRRSRRERRTGRADALPPSGRRHA